MQKSKKSNKQPQPQYPQTLSRNITKVAEGVYAIRREYVPERVPARPHAFTCAKTGEEFVVWTRGSRPWADKKAEEIKLPELFLRENGIRSTVGIPPELEGLL